MIGQIFSIASWQANGCMHDTVKKTSEMILLKKICPLSIGPFVLNSPFRVRKQVVQKMILIEGK